MPFKKFVETGRIARCSFGPLRGRLVSIVDVIDQNRVIIDGPLSKVPRQQYRLNDLHLTKFRIKFPYTAKTKTIRKAWIGKKVKKEFVKSQWPKRGTRCAKKTNLSDFDRFKVRHCKINRNKLLTNAYNALKSRAKKDGFLFGKNSIKPFVPRVQKVKAKKTEQK